MSASVPSTDAELDSSRQAAARGDVAEALRHAGLALVADPMRPAAMAQLNEVLGPIMNQPDPLARVPMTGEIHFAAAATRAYMLAWMKRWVEALDLITDVAEIRPDVPYLRWAEWWLGQPGVAESIGWPEMSRGIIVDLAQIAMRCPVPTPADDPRLANLQAASRIIGGLRALFPREAFLWFTGSLIGRRLGQLDLALAMAQQAYHLEPAWKNAIGVANVLRDQHKVDDAATWFKKALAHDPTDVSALLDLGDTYLDAARWSEAASTYAAALARQPEHPWALASEAYARYRATGEPAAKLALLAQADGDGNDRAAELALQLEPPVPYVTFLPPPADASCVGLGSVIDQMWNDPAAHAGATLHLGLSHVESPSVVAAFRLQLEQWGVDVAIDYQVERIQRPDPRVAKAQVPLSIWQWDGTQPRATVARPTGAVPAAVARLAREPMSLEVWVPRAQAIARELGTDAIGALLGALAHPPAPEAGRFRVMPWVQRVQLATTLVLAHIDDGWQGSHRQRVLYALLYGPTDWTTTASIVALGVLARADGAIRRDVEAAFGWMRTQVPAEGFCCWAYPLACTWQALGEHTPAVADELAAWQQRLREAVGQSTVLRCELSPGRAGAVRSSPPPTGASDADPVVFAGAAVARLSDYVRLMKMMQTGNMTGALAEYRLDSAGYGGVASAWTQRLTADAELRAKFDSLMQR
ncbi:MAG: tetratricopeptide repeat protein [Kofleriaceae bacterium]